MKNQDTKTYFITGASVGLGKEFALHALESGHNVIATARRFEKLNDLTEKYPQQVLTTRMDVTDRETIKKAIHLGTKTFGRIDVLINNAGYGSVGAIEETPEDELRAQMETNFFGAMAVIQELLPAMREQKSGAIINISSMGGQLAFAGFGAYCASKFALEGASEALRQELEPFGIKVLICEPGQLKTEFAGAALKHMPKIAAYDEVVGGTREFAASMHGTQTGDASLVPVVVEKALASETTPLRLQVGSDSVEAVRAHSQQLLQDLEAWKTEGASIDFQPAVG